VTLRTRHLLASTALLALVTGTAACTAEVDGDGARIDVEDDGLGDD
jgi:hypothetical protein